MKKLLSILGVIAVSSSSSIITVPFLSNVKENSILEENTKTFVGQTNFILEGIEQEINMPEIAYQFNNIHSYIKSFNIKNFKFNSFEYFYRNLDKSRGSGAHGWQFLSLEDLINLINQVGFQLNKFYVKTKYNSPNGIYSSTYLTYTTNSSKETTIKVDGSSQRFYINELSDSFEYKHTIEISF